jgi:hypothetical protein
MIWSEVECHATGEHEIKEPQDESQKRVLQSSGDIKGFKRKLDLICRRLPREIYPSKASGYGTDRV